MSWRFSAISIGYAVLISGIGPALYAFYFHEYNTCSIGLFALNILACASWLRGAIFRNKVFMVPSLIFWGILLSIWIFYAMFAVGTSEMKGQNEKFILLLVSLAILTILYVGCYLLTVIVCILMKTAKTQCRTSISVFQDPESCTAINETNALKSKYFDM